MVYVQINFILISSFGHKQCIKEIGDVGIHHEEMFALEGQFLNNKYETS